MSEVTRILSAIEQGDQAAADELLPLVYAELRRLAARKLSHEKPGQTLQATDLVHEAYMRLVDVEKAQHWDSCGHFFAAAAKAMRGILVDNARRKKSELGQTDEARQSFEMAQVIMEHQLPKLDSRDLGGAWHDLLMCHIARREAEALIGVPKSVRRFLRGQEEQVKT